MSEQRYDGKVVPGRRPEPVITQATAAEKKQQEADVQRTHEEALKEQNRTQQEHGQQGVPDNAVVGKTAPLGGSQASDPLGRGGVHQATKVESGEQGQVRQQVAGGPALEEKPAPTVASPNPAHAASSAKSGGPSSPPPAPGQPTKAGA